MNTISDVGYSFTRKKVNDPKYIGLWKMGRTLGSGCSGRVRIARHSKTGELAAVKIVSKVQLDSRISLNHLAEHTERARLSIEREIVVLKLLDHPNVMRLYDVWETSSELFLILEYVQGGELFDHLCQKGKLPLPEALSYFQQIISAINYCHRFNIAHRDLKPENILLDQHFNIKVADFGMAVWQADDANMLHTSCGSPHYAAPELIRGEPYRGSTADTWSCGVILFALLTGRLPFDHENNSILLEIIKTGKYDIPHDVEPVAEDLIRQMLHPEPTERITMPKILQHPFFNLQNPKLDSPLLPNVIDIAHPLRDDTSIDPHIFMNLKALWHDTPEQNLMESLFDDRPTWPKAVYHLLMAYRSKHATIYEEEEEMARKQLECRRSRKNNQRTLRNPILGLNLDTSPSHLPPRTDPPTPRRAARRVRPLAPISNQSNSSTSNLPMSPKKNADDMSKAQNDKRTMVRFEHHPEASTADNDFADSSYNGSFDLTGDLPSIPTSTLSTSLERISLEHMALEIYPSDVAQHGETRPLSIQRKSTYSRENKENISDQKVHVTSTTPPSKGKRQDLGRRVQIVEPLEQRVSGLFKKGKRRMPFGGSAFSSSPPRRTWLGNVFHLRPATYSLISVHDIQATRTECKRLLMKMNVHVTTQDAQALRGLGGFKCKLDEVREASGVLNVVKTTEFRVVFQRPQACGEGSDIAMSLTLIHEKGSSEMFREVCKQLEEDWDLEH